MSVPHDPPGETPETPTTSGGRDTGRAQDVVRTPAQQQIADSMNPAYQRGVLAGIEATLARIFDSQVEQDVRDSLEEDGYL